MCEKFDRLGCAGLGYLVGPTIGTLLFKAFNGSKNKSMEVMDKRWVVAFTSLITYGVSGYRELIEQESWPGRFYDHIKSRRVDPSYQSINVSSCPSYLSEIVAAECHDTFHEQNPTPDYYGMGGHLERLL